MNRVSPWTCAFAALLLYSSTLGSEPVGKTEESCHPGGQVALEEGRFDLAKNFFKNTRERALQDKALNLASSCAFYLGLTSQLEAQAPEASEGREALQEAARWYEQVGPTPDAAEGLVGNLARVYSDLGQRDKADRLFVQAIEKTKGDPQLTLLRSYADLLAGQERWDSAAQIYRRVLDSLPSDRETWDVFLAMLSKSIPEQFPGAVWDAVTANQTVTAQEYALEALLTRTTRFSPEQRTALLTAVVAALARQHYSPKIFAEGMTAKRLSQLSEDPIVGQGARLVLSAHDGATLEVAPFRWWANPQVSYGLPPLKAFRELLRSLARRSGEEEIQYARNLLELGDRLAPQVPDLPLYIDLAATYDTLGDRRALSESLRRWEPSINKAADKIDPAQLSNYHLVMAESVHRLNIEAPPSAADSKEYQIKQAKQAAERAGQEMVAVVNSQSRILHSTTEGGAGYGAGAGRRYQFGMLECVEGSGTCGSEARRRVVPGDRDLEEESSQWARDLQSCEAGHRLGRRVDSYPATRMDASAGHQISSVNLARLRHLQLPAYSIRQQTETNLNISMSRGDCLEAKLEFEPGWVTSGAWQDGGSFLLVDALRRRLLRYSLNGDLLWASEETHFGGGRPTRVRQAAFGPPVVELNIGHLAWLDARGMLNHGKHLLGRKGKQGTLRGIEDWTPLDKDAIIAVGNIQAPDGTWISGLVQLPLSSDDFEVLMAWPANDPAGIYYRTGQPYIAALGDKGYFLQVGEQTSLFEISKTSKGTSLRLIAHLENGLLNSFQQALLSLQNPSDAPALYHLIEKINLPAGLYASNGYLYLLKRPEERSGKLSWSLDQIDPSGGRRLHTTTLPTTAHHLTLIPGPTQWALIERGVVWDVGLQETRSVILVPSSVIENTSRPSARAPR